MKYKNLFCTACIAMISLFASCGSDNDEPNTPNEPNTPEQNESDEAHSNWLVQVTESWGAFIEDYNSYTDERKTWYNDHAFCMEENTPYGDQGTREWIYIVSNKTRSEIMNEVEMIKSWSVGHWLDSPNDEIWSYDVFIVKIKNYDEDSEWEDYPAILDPTKP